ncbi:MAG: FKBP-type peptidyl-prolyl cis-trans isomerase [Ferruginibacter sp.]
MKKVSLVSLAAVVLFSACKESFKKGDNGLEYKIISSGSGEKIQYGNFMELNIASYYSMGNNKDSLLSDTRTSPQGAAFEVLDSANMPKEYFKVLSQLKKGDSVEFRILVDSAFKGNPQGIPPMFKKGHYLVTRAKVENIYKTQEEAEKARMASMEKAQEGMKKLAEQQIIKDDKTLQEYFAKNNITAVKAPQGTYVQIITPGTGANVDTSVVAKVNYTGKTMAGKTFDSNIDPAFNHVEPFTVNMTNNQMLGNGVIKGWTDGMVLLNKGAKAKFYIPSSLAYGAQGAGQDIGPNEILVFDIEVLDIMNQTQALDDMNATQKRMQETQQRMMDSMQKAQAQPAPAQK